MPHATDVVEERYNAMQAAPLAARSNVNGAPEMML